MKSIIRYIKRDVFSSFSIFGVFFLILAIWTCGQGYARANKGQDILSQYVKVEGIITKASEVETSYIFRSTKHYYQDFTVTYWYEGEEYNMSYKDFSVKNESGYKVGDTEDMYINPSNPIESTITTRVSKDYTFTIQCFCMFGIPALIIIFMPKGWWINILASMAEDTSKKEDDNHEN